MTDNNLHKVRAKFRMSKITEFPNSSGKEVEFRAVTDNDTPENARYAKYTPSGTITIFVDNPSALEYITAGGDVYVDFTRATPAPQKSAYAPVDNVDV